MAMGVTFLGGAMAADGISFPVAGTLQTRSAQEIASSPWSIGGETLDRDFTVYAHYKPYLGPLGAKAIRLQAGWAKCERERRIYTWQWLDEIVDDALRQGVQPWLQVSYGNPIYPGGGDAGLGGGPPSSPEALAAWDRWSEALVARYRDRVREWEIWNEPDINRPKAPSVERYVDLFIRTAVTLRRLQPEGRIFALGLAGKLDYADRFLAGLQARGALDLVDAITLHGYPRNPDDLSSIEGLREVVAKYGRAIEVRQGESGASSQLLEHAALRGIRWTENLQAKWNLRRMLAHRAAGVPFNLFTIADMRYLRDGVPAVNHKGLLATEADGAISRAKRAYFAAQHAFTLFDDMLQRIPEYPFSTTSLRRVALTGYERASGEQVVAFWNDDAPPADANGVTLIDVTLPNGRFKEPVLVDLLTGAVHALPERSWRMEAQGVTFTGLPVYDAPLVLAERAAVRLSRADEEKFDSGPGRRARRQSQTSIVK